jgi:hypothetical protein
MKKTMVKEQQSIPPELWELAESNMIVKWIVTNGRTIAYGCLGILIALLAMVRLGWIGNAQTFENEQKAQKEYTAFIKDPLAPTAEETLKTLTDDLNRYPSLRPQYEGKVAQQWIILNKPAEAEPLVNNSLKRTQHLLEPEYRDYSTITLMIQDGKIKEALEQSKRLQEHFVSLAQKDQQHQLPYGDTLFASNILRIAFLQNQLNLSDLEDKTWIEWKEYRDGKQDLPVAISPTVFQSIEAIYTEGQVGLSDYIKLRTKKKL